MDGKSYEHTGGSQPEFCLADLAICSAADLCLRQQQQQPPAKPAAESKASAPNSAWRPAIRSHAGQCSLYSTKPAQESE